MKKEILSHFLIVIFFAFTAALFTAPHSFYQNTFGEDNRITKAMENFKVTLGLDLAGGTELDYKIDLTKALEQNSDDDVENNVNIDHLAESVRDALEKRVNPAGVGEIIVKRSQVNVEGQTQEHILIQMPPSANVEQAKQDAEKDNRLEFFEEEPNEEKKIRVIIAGILNDLSANEFDQRAQELSNNNETISIETVESKVIEQMTDQAFAEKIKSAPAGTILKEIIETQTELSYTIDDNGQLNIDGFPKQVLAIVKVDKKYTEPTETTVEAKANARHILFAYEGALRAGEDVPYKNKEEAKAKAEEILQQIKDGGDFTQLAKEFSTGPSGDQGGDLGEFGPGTMAEAFNNAVFGLENPELIAELVETDFGYHIIEVTNLVEATTQTVDQEKTDYRMLAWDASELAWLPTELGGAQLDAAAVGYDEVGNFLVNLRFNQEGGDLFAAITDRVSKRTCEEHSSGVCRLGIKVGGNWITQPTVREKIVGRNSQITGNFTAEAAQTLANDLNLGAIDAPVDLSGQITIKPELGAEQLAKSVKAAAIGFLGTIIFMIVMYRLPGIIAAIALTLYTGLFFTILKTWPQSFGGPIVLSLAGAAGIALSIGLAVDGNILIFERLKEELRKGKPLSQAVDDGFRRAWSAIRDSNLTTLITCTILFLIGSSIIKGFAITLIIGTLLSMLTAITVSRNLLRFVQLFPALQNSVLYGVSDNDSGRKNIGARIRERK